MRNTATHGTTAFKDLLRDTLDDAIELSALLESECNALITRNFNALQRIISEKNQKIYSLEKKEVKRKALMDARGYPQSSAGMENYIRSHDSNGEMHNLWQQLLELLDRCSNQNRINGSILNARHQAAERVLQLIQGSSREEENKLYDPSGHKIKAFKSRTLAKI